MPFGGVHERSWDSAGALATMITPTTSARRPPAWSASAPGVTWILSPNTMTPSRIPTSGSPAEMAGSDTCSEPALNALYFDRVAHDRVAELRSSVRVEKLAQVAAEFDAVHSIRRAVEVGSVDAVISPAELRPQLIAALDH